MLITLIAVLVLLGAGSYAVLVGATGRAGSGAAPLLGPGRRIGMLAAGVTALALAYAVYNSPRTLFGDQLRSSNVQSNSSLPPETRGDAAVQLAGLAANATVEPKAPADTAAPAAEPVTTAATAAVVAAPTETPAASESASGGLSAGAAAMEAEAAARLRRPAATVTETLVPVQPESAPLAAASTEPTAVVAVTRRGTSGTSARRSATTYRRSRMQASGPLTIRIRNELGSRQHSERLALSIEGKRVAGFEIDSAAPFIELPIKLPRPGLLHYRLEGDTDQADGLRLRGEGCIEVSDGKLYTVRRNPGSRKVFLETSANY